jgi:hypothetical protein
VVRQFEHAVDAQQTDADQTDHTLDR